MTYTGTTNLSSQAFPDEGFPIEEEEITKMSRPAKIGLGAGGLTVGGMGAKYATGIAADRQVRDHPERLDRIIAAHQDSTEGHGSFGVRGLAARKLNPDLVERKYNSGINSWENKSGMKIQRNENPSFAQKINPRYAEHQVLHQAIQQAPKVTRQLHRGVSMTSNQVAELHPGQKFNRGVESWSDNAAKAQKFGDSFKQKGQEAVNLHMDRGAHALNVQHQANWNMSEHIARDPYTVRKVTRDAQGRMQVRVAQDRRKKVSKAGPDASDSHVMGTLKPSPIRRRRGRLKRIE